MIELIAFDGDDTLWHNESLFTVTQDDFRRLLAPHVERAVLDDRLLATERRNLELFGYGVKSFTLSMIETAIEVTDGMVGTEEIAAILALGKGMLRHPVELLDGVEATLDTLAGRYRLVLITKGDLLDQESKVARSGLAERFERIEIVSEKDEVTYRRIMAATGVEPGRFCMVGNALRSDVQPVVAAGGWAVHIPYHVTWAHEQVDPDPTHDGRWSSVDRIADLPALLEGLTVGRTRG